MNKSIIRLLACAALFLSFSTLCFSQNSTDSIRLIHVNGQGEARADANIVDLHFSLNTTGSSSSQAKERSDKALQLLLNAFRQRGMSKRDVIAGSLQTNPEFEYHNNQRSIKGYRASRSIQVELDNLDSIDTYVDAAIAIKGVELQQMQYRFDKPDALQLSARKLAIADSKEKAAMLAKAYNATLGDIYKIEYFSQAPLRQQYQVKEQVRSLAADSFSGAPGVYLPDEIRVVDNISVAFELIPN